MYGKCTLFYESPKNWGYYVNVLTVCTRPLLGGEGLGDEASSSATQTKSGTFLDFSQVQNIMFIACIILL